MALGTKSQPGVRVMAAATPEDKRDTAAGALLSCPESGEVSRAEVASRVPGIKGAGKRSRGGGAEGERRGVVENH